MRAARLTTAALLLLTPASAAADAVKAAADKLCRSRDLAIEGQFDRIFTRDQVTQLVAVFRGFRRDHGPCRKVLRTKGPGVAYVHEKAVIPGRLYVNKRGKITGIWFNAPQLVDDSVEAIVRDLRALPGKVALTVRAFGGETLAAIEQKRPLAVGSTFKLYILAALRDEIAQGRMRWSDVVRLRRDWRSLPSGKLQDWPEGAPVTLQTLATLMISISDNTATDHLLFHLGRQQVERQVPSRNRPLLSTGEMFKLKSKGARGLARRYIRAKAGQRRRILAALRREKLAAVELAGEPTLIDRIEWFFSTDELCRVIASLKDLDLLGVNPGLAQRKAWARVRYKGGSEQGVVNMTHLLQHKKTKRWICVSASWNDARRNLKEDRFNSLVRRLLRLLAK